MAKDHDTRLEVRSKCIADGCCRIATRIKSQMCEMHYYRIRRRGSLSTLAEEIGQRPDMLHSHGYVLEHAPNHPLGTKGQQSRIYQHRLRYYDAHGEGPFSCYWCGVQVSWDDLHIDHLNDVRSDNTLSNLVASCARCNQGRAKDKSAAASRARAKHVYEHRGERLTAAQWAERIGISRNSLLQRIASGWPLDVALTKGRGSTGPNSYRRQA